jgi:PPM family protein phosphatase
MSAATRTRTGSYTIVGRRSTNQDAVYVGKLRDGRELLAVADGMGGHKGGETASKAAIETLVAQLNAGRSLSEAIADANTAVRQIANDNPQLNGMGTTIVALLRSGDRYHIANVGDSRAYRITEIGIEQITADHSFMAEAMAAGQMSAEDAKRSRWRNALTRAIGTDESVDVDVFGPFDLGEAHTVLLCSDGLHGTMADEAIGRTVMRTPGPSTAAQLLVEQAFEAGSKDNITVALASFGERVVARDVEPDPVPVIRKPIPQPVQLILSPTKRERGWLERLFTKFS